MAQTNPAAVLALLVSDAMKPWAKCPRRFARPEAPTVPLDQRRMAQADAATAQLDAQAALDVILALYPGARIEIHIHDEFLITLPEGTDHVQR